MYPQLSALLRSLQEDGFGVGNLYTDAVLFPATWEYTEGSQCECGSAKTSIHEHVSIFNIAPLLGDFSELALHDQRDIIETTVSNYYPFPEDKAGDESFDPSELSLEELLQYEGFEETLLVEFSEHYLWEEHLKEDYSSFYNRYIWPVYPASSQKDLDAIATLVHRETKACIYLVDIEDGHVPAGMSGQGSYAFLMTADDEDCQFNLCVAYICAGQLPPRILLEETVRHLLDSQNKYYDGIFGWLILCAAAQYAQRLFDVQLCVREMVENAESMLEGPPTPEVNSAYRQKYDDAWLGKIRKAGAALSLMGLTPQFIKR